ncbi:MAG: hypothetical protein Q4E65_08510 [Clostridia bacterium]|nr:hypothetical protein [Clostridia bacterium]
MEDCLYDDEGIESTDEYTALSEAISSAASLTAAWGSVTAAAQAGEEAAATVQVDEEGVAFSFVLPKGDKGAPGVSVTVGETATGEPGTAASVTNTGTASDPVLKFTIPKGDTGAAGPQGATGPQGESGAAGATGENGKSLVFQWGTGENQYKLGVKQEGTSGYTYGCSLRGETGADGADAASGFTSSGTPGTGQIGINQHFNAQGELDGLSIGGTALATSGNVDVVEGLSEGLLGNLVESNQNYLKYADGTLICFGSFSATPTYSAWGNVYISNIDPNVTFAKTFVSAPYLITSCGFSPDAGLSTNDAWLCSVIYTATRIGSIGIARANSTVATQYFKYVAIGKWK